MVGTWMLCGNGRSMSGRYHGWHMDALWERMEYVWTLSWLAHECSVGTDVVCLDVIMVGTWMLCGNGRSLSGRYHGGCSVGTDEVCLDVIMVGPWMLCVNGWSLSGCYHGGAMDALRERREFVWTLSWLAHGCCVGTDGVCLDVIMVGMLPPEHTRGGAFSAAKSTKQRKYRCGRPVRGAREQHVGALNKPVIAAVAYALCPL